MKSLPSLVMLTTLLLAALPAQAEQHAHEHGVARLGLVQAGADLSIELSSPLDSIVGFEHAPADAAQTEALEAAMKRLEDPATVVALPAAAGCTSVTVDVDQPFGAHAHEDDAQEREAEHDHGDEHEHEHEGEDHDAHGEHADLAARYDFTCTAPAALEVLDVRLFEHFSRMQRVEVEAVTDRGQGAARLTREQRTWPLPQR